MTLAEYFEQNRSILENFELDDEEKEKIDLWYSLHKNDLVDEPHSYDYSKYLERSRYLIDKKGSYEFFGIVSANNLLPWEVVRMLECDHKHMRRKDIDIVVGFNHASDYQYTTAIYSCPDCGLTNRFNDSDTIYQLEAHSKVGFVQTTKISTSFMWELLHRPKKKIKLKSYLKKKEQ